MSKSVPALSTRLSEAALVYLGRYEASRSSLERVLARKLRRWAMAEGWEIDAAAAATLAEVLRRLAETGAVDDARFAETRARRLHRAGRSARAIRAHLAARGVGSELAEAALAERADGADDADLAAALLFARKKRLGRFRPAEARADRRDRDLAALGRAGFSWEVARRVVDAED